MSSILTNNSAMVALQTLKTINKNLAMVQGEISTGKSVADASDNSAVWAISKVMESDVKGFKAIADSLALGESTVAVARSAAETVTDLLTDIKGKIVAAQEENVDRAKIQDDINALIGQVQSVTAAAQFNGLNLVDGSITDTNSNTEVGIDVLSSLNRDANGNVVAANIGIDAQNLSTNAGTALSIGSTATADAANMQVNGADVTADAEGNFTATFAANDGTADGGLDYLQINAFDFLENDGGDEGTTALAKETAGVDNTNDGGLVEGDIITLRIGNVEGSYVVQTGDTGAALAAGLKNGMLAAGLDEASFNIQATAAGALTVENLTNNATTDMEFSMSRGTGALSDLTSVDVTTTAGAASALVDVETMIQSSIDAAASFGSSQSRIETQTSFISNLTDSLRSGIGAMVDADMEEASARLQALQTQQQLGVQALSIANQAPQTILQLFR